MRAIKVDHSAPNYAARQLTSARIAKLFMKTPSKADSSQPSKRKRTKSGAQVNGDERLQVLVVVVVVVCRPKKIVLRRRYANGAALDRKRAARLSAPLFRLPRSFFAQSSFVVGRKSCPSFAPAR